MQRPVTACNTLAVEGMEVATDTPRLQEIRRDILQLILADHPLDCPVCDKAGGCLLQRLTYDLGVAEPGHPLPLEGHRPIRDWPLIEYEPQRCITCMRCIKVCHEVIGLGALALKGKGYRARVGPSKGQSLNCEFCGECVEICPTGALLSKPFRAKAKAWELQGKPTVCPYCPAGCRLGYQIKGNRVMRAVSIPGPPNEGTLCVGGRFGFDVMHHPARLITPYLRENRELVPVNWEKALGFVAGSLSQIKEAHGPDAIAGITSPRVPTEDQYAFQKFFRVAVGTHSVDSEARFSHLRVFKALELTCATSGVTPPLEELLSAEGILVLGSDPTEEVPALSWKIRQATRRFDSQVIVANARRTDLMRFSVCPMHHRPYSEVALLLRIMKVIWEEGLWRRDFVLQQVSNAPALLDLLGRVSLRRVLRETGVEEEALREAASLIGKASSAAFIFGGDVILQRDGLQCVAHLANLALLTGHVNKPHCGPHPLYEKNNLQGLCDMGGAPEFLPGYQSLADARSFFEEVWGNALPHTRGRTLPEMVMAMESGEIKALLIMGADPLTAFPNAARWEPALKSLELTVVRELFPSDTAQMAHCILPALSFAEREGAYTTLEHRLLTFEPILEAVGTCRAGLGHSGASVPGPGTGPGIPHPGGEPQRDRLDGAGVSNHGETRGARRSLRRSPKDRVSGVW